MPRIPTVLQSELPYYVGARAINGEWFSLPMPEVWRIFSEQLYFVHHAFGIQILAFALMNNHFHLLLKTPRANLSEGMTWFMRESSRALTRHSNRINQSFRGRHFRTLIRGDHHFMLAYKYIYACPLKAGITDSVLDYPYSTLPGLLGREPLLIPVEFDPILFADVDGILRWLNTPADTDNWKAVRLALHRREFRLSKVDSDPHSLENNML